MKYKVIHKTRLLPGQYYSIADDFSVACSVAAALNTGAIDEYIEGGFVIDFFYCEDSNEASSIRYNDEYDFLIIKKER